MFDDDDGKPPGRPPLTPEREAAIATLYEQAHKALAFAEAYEDGGMTSFDVARFYGRGNARDSYSSVMHDLNEDGVSVWVSTRPCVNAIGDLQPMHAYRLRRDDDPPAIIRPPKRKTPLDKVLRAFRKLSEDDQIMFARRCDPMFADFVWLLLERMDPSEQWVFLDWQAYGPPEEEP